MPPLVWTENCCIVSISILLYISVNQDIFITKKQTKTAWQGRDVETEHEKKKKDVWSENFNLRRRHFATNASIKYQRSDRLKCVVGGCGVISAVSLRKMNHTKRTPEVPCCSHRQHDKDVPIWLQKATLTTCH